MADRSILVRVKGDLSDLNRALLGGAASAKAFTGTLDTSTDRMQNLVQTSLALGPALVPIGAAAVPAISGLTNQLAFAAAGAGVAALAFSGVGDALKATNDYAIEPSAANFDKMQQSLRELGPAGREFVGFLQEIRPQLQGLQDAAQEGLFPGAEAGIRDLMTLLPQAERIVSTIAETLGDLVAEAGDNLADPRWADFFNFLETEARPTLLDMGRTLGNFAEGFANLWMAFDPLSDQFSSSFLQMSRDFAEWTDGLSQTDGFQEFVDYINTNGPRAWDAITALGNALLQIVEAAAPVGSVMLPVIKVLADTLASIADSPVGPVLIGAAAGISAISRAVALYNAANGSAMSQMLTGMRGSGPYLKGAAAGIGILALSLTDLDEKMGVSHTATLTLAGAVAGPWGAAAGAGIGAAMDFAAANDDLWSAISRANTAVNNGSASLDEQGAALDAARKKVAELHDAVRGTDTTSLSEGFKTLKNEVEGWFGKSDVEEADAALAALEVQQQQNIESAMAQQFAQAGMGDAMRGATADTREQVSAILDLIAEHNALHDTLLSERGGLRGFEQAIDDATAAAKKNGRTLDINTQAGRDNEAALDDLAQKWNDLTPAQQNAEGASDRARAAFIRVAIDMGKTRKQAEKLADEYLDIPTDVSTNVHSNAPAVTASVRALFKALDALDGKVSSVHIRTYKELYNIDGGSPSNSSIEDMLHPAGGGYIRGPGGPREDAIPAMVSNGEFVVNAAATADNLPLLFAINNSRKYADGGMVGGPARLQRFADGGSVRAPAVTAAPAGPFVADLSGARIEMGKDGFGYFVDGRIRIAAQDAAQEARFS